MVPKFYRYRHVSARGLCKPCREFSTTGVISSGHSRWSTIKHDKARNDKLKSKERQLLTKEIVNSSQSMQIVILKRASVLPIKALC